MTRKRRRYLTDEEKLEILRLGYIENQTMEAIGSRLGRSRQAVRKVICRAASDRCGQNGVEFRRPVRCRICGGALLVFPCRECQMAGHTFQPIPRQFARGLEWHQNGVTSGV